MRDRRITPANGRVAAVHLREEVEAQAYVAGAARQLAVPVADLLRAPEGKRERQLLAGQVVSVYEDLDGWSFVQAVHDGYVGYVRTKALGVVQPATHRVSARATHVYTEPDFKSPERVSLSMGSRMRVLREDGRFAKIPSGFVPLQHLSSIEPEADPVAVAERLSGTPYLWGGNSAFGIDCSGLVQAGCLACDIDCPGDSDLQEAAFANAGGAYQRGDLLFWKGHVAWVADAETLLHANAHHMAVAYEPINAAIRRIEEQGDGPVTGHKRIKEFT